MLQNGNRRAVAALLFGLATAITPIAIQGTKAIPRTWDEGIVMIAMALLTAYAKWSSNTTIISPNREVWSPEKRAAAAAVTAVAAAESAAETAADSAAGKGPSA